MKATLQHSDFAVRGYDSQAVSCLLRTRVVAFCVCCVVLACAGCPADSLTTQVTVPTTWIRVECDRTASDEHSLTAKDVDRLKNTIPTITHLVTERHATVEVTRADRTRRIDLCATTPDAASLLAKLAGYTIADGRFLTTADRDNAARSAVLSQETCDALFGTDRSVGAEIMIAGQAFTVVGVLQRSRPAITADDFHDVYVVDAAFDVISEPSPSQSAVEFDRIWIDVSTPEEVAATRAVVKKSLAKGRSETSLIVK